MHRFLRITGLASMGLAGVLLASGCSSGGSDKASDKPSSGKAPAASSSPARTPGGPGSSSTPAQGKGHGTSPTAGGIDGDWVAVTQGKPVALVIKGKNASVLGEHLCNGTANSAAGSATLLLKCPDGNTTRTRGTAKLNGSTLEVSWEGVGSKDEFTRNKTSR
ncbi:hypothetical protein ACIBL5_12065 [Streptomyces sp. NPDC050516]|uniref:hypothetical protein n=1 Tax=Streptomyces sp. NPDC050516 TaxID=3365621 RepID=UPI00379EB8CA